MREQEQDKNRRLFCRGNGGTAKKRTHVGNDHPRLTAALVELGDLRDGALLAGGEVDGGVDAAGLVVGSSDEGVLAVEVPSAHQFQRP